MAAEPAARQPGRRFASSARLNRNARRRTRAGRFRCANAGARPVSAADVFRTDLTLLHAPSVYDFRTSVIMHGPIADAVPSTNEFEMYPVGLTSIASYLSANHYNVRIVNLAYLMLARAWLRRRSVRSSPAPQGLRDRSALAAPCPGRLGHRRDGQRHHPRTPVLFGGLSGATTTRNWPPTLSSTLCCEETPPRSRVGSCSLTGGYDTSVFSGTRLAPVSLGGQRPATEPVLLDMPRHRTGTK